MSNRDLLNGLVNWCNSQRDLMTRANEMMRAGLRHTSSSDGRKMIDTTGESISENDRRIAELDELLASIASGAYDAHRP
jgi:hypothetical protein